MTAILNNSRERGRFFRFAVVGAIGGVVDFGVMNLLTQLFHYPLILAGTISFIAAVLSNFTWNRYWTYPDSRARPLIKQLTIFTFVSLVGLAIRIPLLAILEPLLEQFFARMPLNLPFVNPNLIADNLTLAITIMLVLFWNFFVNRYWTYNDIE